MMKFEISASPSVQIIAFSKKITDEATVIIRIARPKSPSTKLTTLAKTKEQKAKPR